MPLGFVSKIHLTCWEGCKAETVINAEVQVESNLRRMSSIVSYAGNSVPCACQFVTSNSYSIIFLLYEALRHLASFFFSMARQPLAGLGLLMFRGFTITLLDTPHSVWLLWTSDQPVAETSTWQHTTFTRDRHPCPRRDSNPQSQQASGRRPTPHGHCDWLWLHYETKNISEHFFSKWQLSL
jgi:hypothetical protein